jgi:hypothetical protein
MDVQQHRQSAELAEYVSCDQKCRTFAISSETTYLPARDPDPLGFLRVVDMSPRLSRRQFRACLFHGPEFRNHFECVG